VTQSSERAQVDLGSGLVDIEILGIHRDGVKIRTLTSDPHAWLVVPAHWVTGYRPIDHPELNHTVTPERAQYRLTDSQHAVLKALAAAGELGMLDDDHELVNGLRADSAGKRRLELARKGYVTDTGRTRNTRRHKTATVWAITGAGREALVAHDTALVAV
jgi:DNA-binding PadR family transcriptional regulator